MTRRAREDDLGHIRKIANGLPIMPGWNDRVRLWGREGL